MQLIPVNFWCQIEFQSYHEKQVNKGKGFNIVTGEQLDKISEKIQRDFNNTDLVQDYDESDIKDIKGIKGRQKIGRIIEKRHSQSQLQSQSQPDYIDHQQIQQSKIQTIQSRRSSRKSTLQQFKQDHMNMSKQNLKQPKSKPIHKNQPTKALCKKFQIHLIKRQIQQVKEQQQQPRSSTPNLIVVLKKDNIKKKKKQLQKVKTQTITSKHIRTFQELSKIKLQEESSQNSGFKMRLRGRDSDRNSSRENSVASQNIKKQRFRENKRQVQVKEKKKQVKKKRVSNQNKQENNQYMDQYKDMFNPDKFLLANSQISKPLRQNFIKKVLTQVPGRREEASIVFDFIIKSENGSSAPLCIHGNTGCGKTSMITKIVQFMSQRFPDKMSSVYLNCMSMYDVKHVYSGILDKLFGFKQKKADRALNDLFLFSTNGDKKTLQKFKKKNGQSLVKIKDLQKTKIIVLDQIDHFKQESSFMYNLVQWTHMKDAKIILILVSNVIDFSVQMQAKIQSRLKSQIIVCKPYSFGAIQQIFYFKYPDADKFFQKNSICFLCKKVASINSDIRLMQKIYEQAMDNWKRNSQQIKKITIDQVQNSAFLSGEINTKKLLKLYEPLIKVLHNAKPKSQITSEVRVKYFLTQRKSQKILKSQQILLLLCELKDFGLIQLSDNVRNADVTFQGWGIKINEKLHLLCPEDYQS